MTIKTLYRYNENGQTVDSLELPTTIEKWEEYYRLVADKDKVLTKDGEHKSSVIDIKQEELDLWYEVEKPARERRSRTTVDPLLEE